MLTSKVNSQFLDILFEEIKTKCKIDDPEKSYTAFLSQSGVENITKKVIEEAFEVAISAIDGKNHQNGKQQIIAETADLFYHVLVLLASKNVELEDVIVELKTRNQNNNLSKKAIAKNKIKLGHGK